MILHFCPLLYSTLLHRYTNMDPFASLCTKLFKPKKKYKRYNEVNNEEKTKFEEMLRTNKLKDKEIFNPAFLSTSISSLEDNDTFSIRKVHFLIKANELTRGLYLKSVSEYAGEDEVLIQRQQIFIIDKTYEINKEGCDDGKQFIVHVHFKEGIIPKEVKDIKIFK